MKSQRDLEPRPQWQGSKIGLSCLTKEVDMGSLFSHILFRTIIVFASKPFVFFIH